ncbi:hypothetical protein PTTG_28122 [Puccinia triticina 1-1 BBBD Race 1]|uniref:Uncharacterized protein n=1 Tax=Puccinia triticina (isolate 1-1 / race 1 (BBBD)) TaxID=630390 RepID=A0A180GEC2_PUCT1|nr:hypothetical protein PTTG_28122 [Puccinia triticina 1-1 BBBD Race 1]
MDAFNRKDAMDDKGLSNIPTLTGDNYTLDDVTPHQVWTLLKRKYAAQSIFSLCRVWEDWDSIYYDTTLMQYIDKVHECLTEFKTLGIDVTHVLFSCCIISRVSRVKRSIMETILNDPTIAADPFQLLAKLRDQAIFEVTQLKRNSQKRKSESTPAEVLSTNAEKIFKEAKIQKAYYM